MYESYWSWTLVDETYEEYVVQWDQLYDKLKIISKDNAYIDPREDDLLPCERGPSSQENKNFKLAGGEGEEAISPVHGLPARNARNYEVSSAGQIDEADMALEDDSVGYEVDE